MKTSNGGERRSSGPQWVEVKRFIDGDVGVSIRRDMAASWPKFSLKYGTVLKRDDGTEDIGAFARVFIVRDSALPARMGDTFARLASVSAAAEGFLEQEIAAIELTRLNERVARDLAKVKYGPKGHPTREQKRADALRAKKGRR